MVVFFFVRHVPLVGAPKGQAGIEHVTFKLVAQLWANLCIVLFPGEGDPQSRGGAPDFCAAADRLAGGGPGPQRGVPRPLLPHPGGAGGGAQWPQAGINSRRKESTHTAVNAAFEQNLPWYIWGWQTFLVQRDVSGIGTVPTYCVIS